MDEMSALGKAAAEFAARGFLVFPLKPRGKEPITQHGFKDATCDEAQVREWWSKTPAANIGIATGRGLFVVDVDVHGEEDGLASLREWEREHGKLPETATVRSGGGGLHLYYHGEAKSGTHVKPGVDVRGVGGYIVAPPSVHPTGQRYEWVESPEAVGIAEADGNVLALITGEGGAKREARGAIREGERNETLFKMACEMRRAGRRADSIRAEVHGRNLLECEPPLPDEEVEKILGSALKDGGDFLEVFPEVRAVDFVTEPVMPPEVICGVLRKGATLVVTGKPKAGKSWLLMELALSVATGGKWIGIPCEKGRVLYVDGELSEPEANKRFQEIAKHNGIDGVACGMVDILPLRGHAQRMDLLAPTLIETASGKDYLMMIIDPAYVFMGGDENAAGDVREHFTNPVDSVARATGCAVAVAHHHSKGDKGDVDPMDRASGSGVFARWPDALFDLTEVFPSDGEEAQGDARAFRVTPTLRSFAPMAPFEVWFRHPVHVRDAEGSLSDYRPMTRQRRGGQQSGEARREKRAAEVALAEGAIAEAMGGGDSVDTEAAFMVYKDKGGLSADRTFRDYVQETIFEFAPGSKKEIRRRA